MKACHASGKTFVAAATVLWWVTRFRDGIVVTTAPTWTQVERVLWGEIHRAVQRSRIKYPPLNQTELKLGRRTECPEQSRRDFAGPLQPLVRRPNRRSIIARFNEEHLRATPRGTPDFSECLRH